MKCLRFLEFTVDPRERQVRRGEAAVPISGKAFDVLFYMASNPARPLLKEELLTAVWPDSIVEESNLTYHVYQLRKALAASGPVDSDLILTLPGRGYQFAGIVQSIEGAPDPPASPDAVLPVEHSSPEVQDPGVLSRTSRILRPRGFAAIVVVVAGLAAVVVLSLPRETHLHVSSSTRLTNDGVAKHLNEVPPVLVSDGNKLIFIEKADNQSRIAEVSVDGGEVQSRPAPFPNSDVASYSRVNHMLLVGSIWQTNDDKPIIAEGGGQPQHQVGELTGHDASWSPDGHHIAIARSRFLYVSEADGSNVRRIAATDGVLYFPRWSPDGKVLRFTENLGTLGERIWEVNADGSHLHRFLDDSVGVDVCCGTWSGDGRNYFYLKRVPGASSIWVVGDTAKVPFAQRLFGALRPTQVTEGMTDLWEPPLPTPDGRSLWTVGSHPRGELMATNQQTQELQSYLGGISAEGVSFSPDHEWIAYTSYPDGTLWRSRVDGSEKLKLSQNLVLPRFANWSPDSSSIAFIASIGSAPAAIYLVSVQGGEPHRLLNETASEGVPNWSPDGKEISFGRLIDYGTEQNPDLTIEIYSFERHSHTTLHGSQGLWTARWSPDGRFISAVTQDSRTLRLFDMQKEVWTDLASIGVNDAIWSPDSRYVYFDTFFGNDAAIYRVEISTHKLERRVDLRGFPRGGFYGPWLGMTPDGLPMVLKDTSIEEIYRLDLEASR